MPTVCVVSLGAMGSAMAEALGRGGARVVATLNGRSARTVPCCARVIGRAASRPRRCRRPEDIADDESLPQIPDGMRADFIRAE